MTLPRFARLGLVVAALVLGRGSALAQQEPVDFGKLGLTHGELFKLDVDTTPGRPMDVQIPIDGMPYVVKLNPHSIRGQGFQLLEAQGEKLIKVDPGEENTLRGQVVKDPGSVVAGGVMPDGLYLTIHLGDGRVFWVEPAASRVPGLAANTHVLYRDSDVLQGQGFCGTQEGAHGIHDPGVNQPTTRGLVRYTAEVAVEADFEYYNRYGSVVLTNNRIFLVYNVLNVQYERDVDIQHAIVNVIVNTVSAPTDPYDQSTTGGMLDEMRNWWNFVHSGIPRDIAHLFTGKPTGGVIGTAYIGVVCGSLTTGFGYGVSQTDFNAGNLSSACDLVAHETGHNWNSCHCPCGSPAFTMNPSITSINRFGSVADECSTNSISAIVGHRNTRACLGVAGVGSDPPLNDACAAAASIGPGTWAFGNIGATNDGPAACATTGTDIWYVYDAPHDATITLSTCGTHDMNGVDLGMDTVLVVYTGSCGALTQISCNDDNTGQCGSQDSGTRRDSYLQFSSTRGTRYFIRVAGFNGSTGNGFINFFETGCFAPANDNCGSATPILDGTYSFSTLCATTDGFVDNACNFFSYSQTGSDIWYSYAPQCSGNVTVSLCGSSYDTKVAIYGGGCPTVAHLALACNDDSCGTQSSVTFAANLGNTYLIRIGGYNNTQGVGAFSVSNATCPVPINNNCAAAIDVSSTGTWTGHLAGATNDNATPDCGSSTTNRDVWYRFTACANGTAVFNTCGTHDAAGVDTGMDTTLGVFASCGGPLETCNDDGLGQCGGLDSNVWRDSYLSLHLNAGETRLIRLSHFSSSTPGPFIFNASFTPDNNDCTSAAPAFDGTNYFCTVGATDYFGITESCLFGSQPFKDVWFAYSTPFNVPVRLTTCDPLTGFDTMIAVYQGGCPILNNQAIACNDDDFSCAYVRASTLTFPANAGTTYYIRVGGFSSGTPTGPGNLNIDPICPADVDSDGAYPGGTPDGGVDIADLLFFLAGFEAGDVAAADLDNDGADPGTPDGGVDIADLLFFLFHFEQGC